MTNVIELACFDPEWTKTNKSGCSHESKLMGIDRKYL